MTFRDRSRQKPAKQERAVAKEMGGKRVPFSGALPHEKGDVVTDRYLLDAKLTGSSFALTANVLSKVVLEATRKGKVPAIQVDVERMPLGKKRWIVIPYEEFLRLGGFDE